MEVCRVTKEKENVSRRAESCGKCRSLRVSQSMEDETTSLSAEVLMQKASQRLYIMEGVTAYGGGDDFFAHRKTSTKKYTCKFSSVICKLMFYFT